MTICLLLYQVEFKSKRTALTKIQIQMLKTQYSSYFWTKLFGSFAILQVNVRWNGRVKTLPFFSVHIFVVCVTLELKSPTRICANQGVPVFDRVTKFNKKWRHIPNYDALQNSQFILHWHHIMLSILCEKIYTGRCVCIICKTFSISFLE